MRWKITVWSKGMVFVTCLYFAKHSRSTYLIYSQIKLKIDCAKSKIYDVL